MKYDVNFFKTAEVAYLDKQEPERLRSLAQLFWRSLLLLAVVTVISFLAYGALSLAAVLAPAQTSDSVSTQASIGVDKTALDALLASYAARDAHYKEISTETDTVGDPSIKR